MYSDHVIQDFYYLQPYNIHEVQKSNREIEVFHDFLEVS